MHFTPPSWLTPDRCPGIWTELSSLPAGTEIHVGAHDIVCVRSSARPDFWCGNYLLFDPARDPSFYLQLCEEWQRCFGDMAGVARVNFTTELGIGESSPWQTFLPEFGLVEHLTVLALGDFHPVPMGDDCACRIAQVVDDEDFESVIEASEDMVFAAGGSAPWDFTVWRMREYWRVVCRQPGAAWWAAWDGPDVVAYAGLFRDAGMVSLQEVGTNAAYRRRGIASRLCSAMLVEALAASGVKRCIQVAEPGGDGERVYRRLGFEPVGTLYSLIIPLPPG